MQGLDEIARAAETLREGGVVAFPTETVYGLGADAASAEAVARIYALKGRPADHPVIVHLAHAGMLGDWAADVTSQARVLARHFWPGPLTLILRRQPHVLNAVTGGQDTVALRVPSHPVAHALLIAFGGGIAAPSANRFGRVSATCAAHVRAEFGSSVQMILEGEPCEVGIESTIVDVSGSRPVLLRPGGVRQAALEAALGTHMAMPERSTPRAPGMLRAHYAPVTPLMLVDADIVPELVRTLVRQQKKVAVLSTSLFRPLLDGLTWIVAPSDPGGFAQQLYANLRALDSSRSDVIVVESPRPSEEWSAVLDRLSRAAAGTAAAEDEP